MPISRLPDLIEKSKAEFEKSGLHTTIVSHALDGNFRILPIFLLLFHFTTFLTMRWNNVIPGVVGGGLMLDYTISIRKVIERKQKRSSIAWLTRPLKWKGHVPAVTPSPKRNNLTV